MTLGERIVYYRKREHLSQEALAEQAGVSRQAVSKWEMDQSIPELDKLVALARIFSITTDELLEAAPPKNAPLSQPAPEPSDQLDRTVGLLGRLIRRWGWLAGGYLSLVGAGFTFIGSLAYKGFSTILTGSVGSGSFPMPGMGIPPALTFPLTFAKAIIGLGIAAMITGVVLAVVLYRRGRR